MRRLSIRRYRRKRRLSLRKLLVLCVLLSVILGACAEKRLPQVKAEIHEAALRGFAEEEIAETVPEYLQALAVQPENGLVTLDTYALSTAKAELTCALQEKLNGKACAWVPFGNLTGLMLLNGHGVKVPVVFSVEGTVSVEFESALESAGINRTRYAVNMRVSATLHSLSAAAPGSVTVETAYPVYEAVLEGQVPQYVSGIR